MTPPPSPDDQILFLSKLQRLFAEGDFTATYKFALLIALADLAVEQGRDDGDELQISNHSIAGKFIELYWQQTAPYSTGRRGTAAGVLVQNFGAQAAIIKAIIRFRQHHPTATVQSAQFSVGVGGLVPAVARTVRSQPVNYLQNLGQTTDRFLYVENPGGVELRPGVGYCLRRFQPLVQQLARSHWAAHIKRNTLNASILGDADDLEAFLFETSRDTLAVIATGLRGLTNGRCFYCGSTVQTADVDHFIPFSLYPRDLMHNFVLAHPSCNRSKSDRLAARPHLEHWLEFISRRDDALREIGQAAGRIADPDACRAVARWGYSNAVASSAQAWLRQREFDRINDGYMDCFA